jgi:hypothetical protein
MSIDDDFKKVDPELYNRLKHPSLKQFHDYVAWLRETTVAELWASRQDIAATKAVFIRFFKRGLHAELLLSEMMDMLPSIVRRVDWPEPGGASVIAMLKALTPADMGLKGDVKGVRLEQPPPN